jgi:hypothetical protein
VGAVLPADAAQVDEAKERLVDEGRGLQSVIVAFAAHLEAGQPAKLLVDERHQVIERGTIALAPGEQQLSDIQARPLTGQQPGSHLISGSLHLLAGQLYFSAVVVFVDVSRLSTRESVFGSVAVGSPPGYAGWSMPARLLRIAAPSARAPALRPARMRDGWRIA